jgi:hypothetical protein
VCEIVIIYYSSSRINIIARKMLLAGMGGVGETL